MRDKNIFIGAILRTLKVADSHWFNADPDTDLDPAFFLIADLDFESDPGSRSLIRIQGTGESFGPSVIFIRLDPDLEGRWW